MGKSLITPQLKSGTMKKLLFLSVLLAALQANAQGDRPGFKKENLFTGGSVNASFGSQFTSLGLTPHFGYSLNKYLDVAVTVGVNYQSQRDISYYNANDKLRQTIFGPGMFVRVFPVKFLYAQAQYEYNFIRYKYIPVPNSGAPVERQRLNASSLLVGPGLASGRQPGNNTYYYISVLWDLGKSANSPYKDELNRAVPVFRAGINVGLFQGHYKGGNR